MDTCDDEKTAKRLGSIIYVITETFNQAPKYEGQSKSFLPKYEGVKCQMLCLLLDLQMTLGSGFIGFSLKSRP